CKAESSRRFLARKHSRCARRAWCCPKTPGRRSGLTSISTAPAISPYSRSDHAMKKHSRVAIVTGGATSIGASIVETFAEAGYCVVIADINEQQGVRLAARKANVFFQHTDLRDDGSIGHCVEYAAELGVVTAIVHAACSYVDHGAASNRAQWHESLDVNLVGAALLVQAAAPYMASGGSVVLLGSISAKIAQARRWLYPASKAGVLQLAR